MIFREEVLLHPEEQAEVGDSAWPVAYDSVAFVFVERRALLGRAVVPGANIGGSAVIAPALQRGFVGPLRMGSHGMWLPIRISPGRPSTYLSQYPVLCHHALFLRFRLALVSGTSMLQSFSADLVV